MNTEFIINLIAVSDKKIVSLLVVTACLGNT